MSERRKHRRFIIEDMDVRCKMLFATKVRIINLSIGGASISLNKRLNIGNKYALTIECKDRAVTLKGVVVWEKLGTLEKSSRGEMVPMYEVGIEFDNVLTDKGVELVELMEASAGDPGKLRVRGLRVKIVDQEKAILDYYRSYYVKKISMGGMLIENDQELKVNSKFRMELGFPEGNHSMKFIGRVASCSEIPDIIPKKYNTGIEFIEMSEEDKSRLKGFIDLLEAL